MTPRTTPNVPILGQPFQLLDAQIPVNVSLVCNCGGDQTAVTAIGGAGGTCPSCGRGFIAAFNPLTGKVNIVIAVPETQVPS